MTATTASLALVSSSPKQPVTMAGERRRLATLDQARRQGLKPANDNKPKAEAWPFETMYRRWELGTDLTDNVHLHDIGLRFCADYYAAMEGGSPPEEVLDWPSIMPALNPLRSEAETIESIGPNDGPLHLNDDADLVDEGTSRESGFVDYASYNVFRDTPPPAYGVLAKQTISLAAIVLGPAYRVVVAFLVRRWTLQMIGETETNASRATASAFGNGMVRSAMRQLSEFYARLDRLNQGLPTKTIWPLVGTGQWMFMDEMERRAGPALPAPPAYAYAVAWRDGRMRSTAYHKTAIAALDQITDLRVGGWEDITVRDATGKAVELVDLARSSGAELADGGMSTRLLSDPL